MALARSASGPGGLSINTSSANSLFGSSGTTPATGGMFGNTQAGKPATGLFGATTTTAPAGGLFGSTTTSAPQTGGLFGSTTATSQQQAGGLFGSTAATSQPQTGGLFGSAPQGGGLFANTNTPQLAQTRGLFGSAAATSQPAQGGGLFSSLGTQPVQNQSTAGGLFGGLNTQNQNKPAASMFGGLGSTQNQQTQPQPQPSSMFSTLNQPQAQPSGMFSGGLLGGGLGQFNSQQTVPGVRIDTVNIRGTTRFNDLHEDLQKQIINMDEVIQAQIRLKNDCDAIMPSHETQLSGIPHDVDFIRRKLIGVDSALEQDAKAIDSAQDLVKIDAEHAKLSFKTIDNLKLPPQYHNPGIWSAKSTSSDNRSHSNGEGEAQDLIGFFSSTADEQAKTLEKYQKLMTEIEQHLRGVEASSAQQINSLIAKRNGGLGGEDDPVQELGAILRELEQSILGVAGKVGSAREAMQTLQLGAFPGGPADEKKTNGKRNGVY